MPRKYPVRAVIRSRKRSSGAFGRYFITSSQKASGGIHAKLRLRNSELALGKAAWGHV